MRRNSSPAVRGPLRRFERLGRLFIRKARPAKLLQPLVDDLNDFMRSRVYEDRLIVDDRVTVRPDAVFGRHVVIDDAVHRQDGAGSHRFAILVRPMMLADDVIAKTRTLINAEQTVDAARHPADHTSDHGADRASGGISLIRAVGRAADDALRIRAVSYLTAS